MSMLCALPLAASFFSVCAAPAPLAVGYVEGEYALLAPIETAEVDSVSVERGERVAAGAAVAVLEDSDAKIAVAEAEAALAQAQAQLANLKVGKRSEEIAVLEAAVDMAKAGEADAQRKADRLRDLYAKGTATQADFDTARTTLETAVAEVERAKANLAVGKLPARPDEINAAESAVKQARASLDQARWRLGERVIKAPAAGRISDIIRNPGDVAGPQAPVVSMLPDGAVKLTLYLPEPALSSVKVGTMLDVHCDGCKPGLQARVSYVSPDPEFTPPVIYSLETRQKLVYLIEAKPVGEATRLQPGQIVDVRAAVGNRQ